MFECVGRGCSGGSVPMALVVVSKSISYDGGMMAGATAVGVARTAAAAAAAAWMVLAKTIEQKRKC